uniref:hypothetical protein n=1 Tax=Faecalibacterium prausnitzii TaxID=853 RepID=UPI003FEF749C
MQGKPSRSFGELLDLLLQFIEQRTGKELTKRDIKTITELFNGGDGHTLTGWVEHTCSKRLAKASITVMMKFTSIGWYRSSCSFAYAAAYITKDFYTVENTWLRNDKEYI